MRRTLPGRRGDRAGRRRRCSSQVLPLLEGERAVGALVLLRDVTDLRRRDRMLLSKDATIREIHHRVKNNLQTIASLLRLQGRRLRSPEAQAALAESERRIRSIAIVHETLSREAGDVVRFNEIVRPLARLVEETASSPELTHPLQRRGRRRRAAGRGRDAARGRAQRADAERGRPRVPGGRRTAPRSSRAARARRRSRRRRGASTTASGCPTGFSLDAVDAGLGLSIVQALVTGELGGSIEMRERRRHVRARPRAASRCRGSSSDAGRAGEPASAAVADASAGATSWRVQPLRSRRRSSSVRPPQTPASWLVARANSRHSPVTGH